MIVQLRKVLICLLILYLFSATISYAKPDAPTYAKWGQLAVKTAKEKYPKADIIDYLHIGREDKDTSSTEKFKLVLVESGIEFGLLINIEFEQKTDRVIQIITRKTSS